MSRKPQGAKSAKANAPLPAQMDAVRRLSRAGKHAQAHARVNELRAKYPDFRPLIALAWEVEDLAGNFIVAAMHAWDWSRASTGSVAALEALRDSALDADLPALAMSAVTRLSEAENTAPPDLPPLHAHLRELSFEQTVMLDLSRMFLANARFDEAVAVLADIDHPAARNNLALTHFAQGQVTRALTEFESNWQSDKRNLFALHRVVQLRLWTGGSASAAPLLDPLAAGQPSRPEDAYGQMSGLLLLGAHAEAVAAWQAMREAEFWDRDEPGKLCGICAYLAAIAALRQGDPDLARDCVELALDIDPDNANAAEMEDALALSDLGEEPDCQIGELHDWLPSTWVQELLALSEKKRDAQQEDFDAICARCDAHADYLALATELGGPLVRPLALNTLKQRATSGDAIALQTLRDLLTRPCGPDSERMVLNRWLEDNGFMKPGETHEMLMNGEVKDLQLRSMQLTDEPKETGLPPRDKAKLERMHAMLARGDVQAALRMTQELVAAHPDHPMLLGNMAGIKDSLGHPNDEVEDLYRRALERDPDYLFAIAGLARLASRAGDEERARALLKPLYERSEFHFSEWRTLLQTEQEIARRRGDMAMVLKLDEDLYALRDQFG